MKNFSYKQICITLFLIWCSRQTPHMRLIFIVLTIESTPLSLGIFDSPCILYTRDSDSQFINWQFCDNLLIIICIHHLLLLCERINICQFALFIYMISYRNCIVVYHDIIRTLIMIDNLFWIRMVITILIRITTGKVLCIGRYLSY